MVLSYGTCHWDENEMQHPALDHSVNHNGPRLEPSASYYDHTHAAVHRIQRRQVDVVIHAQGL